MLLTEQLAALAEQNKKLREALIDTAYFLEQHSNRWDGIKGKHPNDVVEAARNALSLPDLASPVLNRVKAEALRSAADEFDAQGEYIGHGQQLRQMADAIEKGEG